MQNWIFTISSGVGNLSQQGSRNPQTFQTEGPPVLSQQPNIGAGHIAFFGVPPVKLHLDLPQLCAATAKVHISFLWNCTFAHHSNCQET